MKISRCKDIKTHATAQFILLFEFSASLQETIYQ